MRVFVATKGMDVVASTTLTDISLTVGVSASALRAGFCTTGDVLLRKGWTIGRCELGRIRGRGSRDRF